MSQEMPPRRHAAQIARLALPLILSNLAQFALVITDTLMLGRYGVAELAAVTLGGALFSTVLLVTSGFAWAAMPVVAEAAAAGRSGQVRRASRMAMWLSLLAALAAMPLFLDARRLFSLLGQDPAVSANAARYLAIAGWGLIPALQVMAMKSALSALERVQGLLWITIGAALLNAALDYALIFGHWGAPEMGLTGAAIASLSVSLASFLVIAAHAALSLPEQALLSRFWRPEWGAFRQIFSLGWPISLTTFAETGLFAAVALMMGWLGTVELAAHGIALQLAAVTFLVQVGFSQVATIRAGQALGRRDAAELRRGAMVLILIALGFALAAIALFLALPEPLVALFLDPTDPESDAVLRLGTRLLMVAALFQLADGGQVLALGLLRGVQDTRVPMLIAVIAYWPLGLGTSYVLGFLLGLGAIGVWSGLVIGLGTAALLMMARFWLHSSRRISDAPAPDPAPEPRLVG